MNSIKIDNMSSEIMDILSEYSETVNEKTKNTTDIVSKNCVKELQSTSPKRTGKYRKGWTRSKISETASKVEYIVHNPKHYTLTHLLENGHVKKDGGRTKSTPHIAPAEEKAVAEFEKLIKEELN